MKELKPIPKFNIGHFPVGTVVDIENVFNKFLPEEERIWEEQLYGLSRGTVTGLEANGVDSYVIMMSGLSAEEDPMGQCATNIQWVRRIISRGKDSCVPYVSPTLAFYAKELRDNWTDPAIKHHSKYKVARMRSLVNVLLHQLCTDPAHLYDTDKLMELVLADPSVIAGKVIYHPEWSHHIYCLNKKRMRKLVARLIPRCRTSRKAAAKAEDEANERYYRDSSIFDDHE